MPGETEITPPSVHQESAPNPAGNPKKIFDALVQNQQRLAQARPGDNIEGVIPALFQGIHYLDKVPVTDPKDRTRQIKSTETESFDKFLKVDINKTPGVLEALRQDFLQAADANNETAKADCLRLAVLLGIDEAALQTQTIPPGADQAVAAAASEPAVPAVTAATASQPASSDRGDKPKLWQRVTGRFRKTPSEASSNTPVQAETGQGSTEVEKPEEENITELEIIDLLEMNVALWNQKTNILLSPESRINMGKLSYLPIEETHPQRIGCIERNPAISLQDALASATEQGVDLDQLEAYLAKEPLDIIYCNAGKISRANDDVKKIIDTAKATINSGEYRNKLGSLLRTNPLIALQTGEGMMDNLPGRTKDIIMHAIQAIEKLTPEQVQQYTGKNPLAILKIVPANLKLLKPETRDALIKEANKIKFGLKGTEHIQPEENYNPTIEEVVERAGKFWDEKGLSEEDRKLSESARAEFISSAAKTGTITLHLPQGPLDNFGREGLSSEIEQALRMGLTIGPFRFNPNTGEATAEIFPTPAEASSANISPELAKKIAEWQFLGIPQDQIPARLAKWIKEKAAAAGNLAGPQGEPNAEPVPQPAATGIPAAAPAEPPARLAPETLAYLRAAGEPEDEELTSELAGLAATLRAANFSEDEIAKEIEEARNASVKNLRPDSTTTLTAPPEVAVDDKTIVPENVSEYNFGKTVKATLPSGKPGETAVYQGTITGIETRFGKPQYVIRLDNGTPRTARPENMEFLEQPAVVDPKATLST